MLDIVDRSYIRGGGCDRGSNSGGWTAAGGDGAKRPDDACACR